MLVTAVALLFHGPPPSSVLQATAFRPWFLTENASISWQAKRQVNNGAWQNSTVGMTVLRVGVDSIFFLAKDGGSYTNLSLSESKADSTFTTLGALLSSLDKERPKNLTYRAQLLIADGPVGRVAALSEMADYLDQSGAHVTLRQLTELPDLFLLRDEVTIVANFSGLPYESQSSRELARVTGIDVPLAMNHLAASVELSSRRVTFESFNADTLAIESGGSTVIVAVATRTSSILASITPLNQFAAFEGTRTRLLEMLRPLNDTIGLLGMNLDPGSGNLTLEAASSPGAQALGIALAPVRWTARGAGALCMGECHRSSGLPP